MKIYQADMGDVDNALDISHQPLTGPAVHRAALVSAFHASFWRDRKVFVTGHTGFKAAWLTLWLTALGARVTTFSLPPHGDGLSDVPLDPLLAHHRVQGRLVTVARCPPRRASVASPSTIGSSSSPGSDGWINGGYMVMEPGMLDYLEGDADSLEVSVLERLVRAVQLAAYRHSGFWQRMDTMRDKQALGRLWAPDAPPWKRW
jgi:hypothetical protein